MNDKKSQKLENGVTNLFGLPLSKYTRTQLATLTEANKCQIEQAEIQEAVLRSEIDNLDMAITNLQSELHWRRGLARRGEITQREVDDFEVYIEGLDAERVARLLELTALVHLHELEEPSYE